jgi:hypothetical protein
MTGSTGGDDDTGASEIKKLESGEVPGSSWLSRPKPTEEFNRMNEDPLTKMCV